MTAATPSAGISVRTFLFGDRTGSTDLTRLRKTLATAGVAGAVGQAAGPLNRAARAALGEQLAEALAPLTEIDLGDVVVLGWRRHRDVEAAARRSLHGPPETLYLMSHRIVSTHQPQVDLLVDGVRVHTFTFSVVVTADLNGAGLHVQGGRLVDVRAGAASIVAELGLELVPRPLLRRERSVDLGLILRLGDRIPLVADPGRPESPGRRGRV